MKRILLFAGLLFFYAVSFAQAPEVSNDASGNKVLIGFITKKDLLTDTAFTWFAENQKGFTPDAAALQTLRANRDSINFIVFGGTWCGDTKHILPQFFVMTDAAGLSPDRITLIGVDHDKKTIQHLSEAFNITNVPTIIVMKNGHEMGRVVEYGKYGAFDKEIGEILGH